MTIASSRIEGLKQAEKALIYDELLNEPAKIDVSRIQATAEALELVVLDLILERFEDDEEKTAVLKQCAADAFKLYRVLPAKDVPIAEGIRLLQMASLAVLGDMGSDAARLLTEITWPALLDGASDWYDRTWSVIVDVWLRLIRKKGWDDRDAVLETIAALRDSQLEFETQYFQGKDSREAKAVALELIGLYHLAKAAEILAIFITDGVVDGNYQVHQLLDTHFDRVIAACETAQMLKLEPLTRLLAATANQMVENFAGSQPV